MLMKDSKNVNFFPLNPWTVDECAHGMQQVVCAACFPCLNVYTSPRMQLSDFYY